MNVNGSNLNANEIFAKLDSMGNGNDGKIEASIWNQFADIAGGNHINNYIEQQSALKSIQTYLSKATSEVKNKIAEYVNSGKTDYSSADEAYNELQKQVEQKTETEKKARVEYNKKIEAHEKIVNTPASNGLSYKDARVLIKSIHDSLFKRLEKKGMRPSDVYIDIATGESVAWRDRYDYYLNENEKADLERADAAIVELEQRYPGIKSMLLESSYSFDKLDQLAERAGLQKYDD